MVSRSGEEADSLRSASVALIIARSESTRSFDRFVVRRDGRVVNSHGTEQGAPSELQAYRLTGWVPWCGRDGAVQRELTSSPRERGPD